MSTRLSSIVLTLLISSSVSAAVTFSLDPASPAIDGTVITPDDVLVNGPGVNVHGTSLGLTDGFATGLFDNLNALSGGRDSISTPLLFSVDRVAVGLPGSAVNTESATRIGRGSW